MSAREEYLSNQMNEFLDRFSPPRAIQHNPNAMQQDADAFLETVLRFAPTSDYRPWMKTMLNHLSGGMMTRSWPAPGELVKACKEARGKPDLSGSRNPVELDSCAIAAKNMSNGMPVAENYLYGRLAWELIDRGLVTNEILTQYRTDAFRSRCSVYGDAAAAAWEVEAIAHHEASREMNDQRKTRRNVVIPNKTAPTKGFET